MKKFIAIIAAIAMIATMSVSVFAAELTDTTTPANLTATETVNAKYATTAEDVHEIWVDLTWGDLEFTYTASEKHWDETNKKWVDDEGQWTDNNTTVEVASRSSKSVTVTVDYTKDAVAASFDAESKTLAVAGDTATFTLTVDADPAQTIAADATAGSIEVTVA